MAHSMTHVIETYGLDREIQKYPDQLLSCTFVTTETIVPGSLLDEAVVDQPGACIDLVYRMDADAREISVKFEGDLCIADILRSVHNEGLPDGRIRLRSHLDDSLAALTVLVERALEGQLNRPPMR